MEQIFVNRHRGEISAVLGGKPYRLCLTLGALAELEDAFGATDLLALAERFENGRISASDALKVIAAGLKGGGNNISADDLGSMPAQGGAGGYVQIVAELLQATFAPGAGPDEKEADLEEKPQALPHPGSRFRGGA